MSACPAVKYGKLYTKELERHKYLALKESNQNYKAKISIPLVLRNDLSWWTTIIANSFNEIRTHDFYLEMFTDASKTGWGAVCGLQHARGLWLQPEFSRHINFLELKAALLGLKCFTKNIRSRSILLRVDNTTALSYINRMGGVQYPELNQVTREIWQWCEKNDLWVFASYIKSDCNKADKSSRFLPVDCEWKLANYAYAKIVLEFGTPEIDLFASRINKKCQKYISWEIDPESVNIDAFTVSWKELKFYAFPPFALICKVLNKIIIDQAEGILVVPKWPSQPWYPIFNDLAHLSNIIEFQPNSALLSSPFRSHHPLHKDLTLVAAVLSGRHLN